MLPKKQRHILYALLLIMFSVVCTSAVAHTRVYHFITEVTSVFDDVNSETTVDSSNKAEPLILKKTGVRNNLVTALVFITPIQGSDDTNGCANDGSTIALFNLCGDSDDRIISLSGSYSTVQWQVLGGACSPDLATPCPNTTPSCYTTVGTGATYLLDASSIPAGTGAEFRVVVDGQAYYFEVKKSTITQTFVKNDFICGVPGRIQITNLSSAYEYSIDNGGGFGPWQGPIFANLSSGTYIVKARLKNTANTCEYPYEPITIDQLDIDIDVTFTDAQCSGDTGSITVTANNVPGPYKYTLLDSGGVAQEFTAFIPDNPYIFSAVGFGTYIVQVETQQCTGDLLNGIDPPRQNLDTGGSPIIIGNGLSALDASTEVNSSFGCSTITDVDIIVNTTGGSAPYTFTVNGGSAQPSYSGSTIYTVSGPGTYDFIITDSNGCTIPASSNVENLLPPDITVNGIDGTCSNGGAKINFTIIDARGYNLSFRADSGDPWESNPQISVAAGTYNTIEVRYQQGGFQCTMSLPSVTVTTVGVITGSAAKISDRTCDGSGGINGGQIDFSGPFSGGSGSGYVFSIDGANFTAITSYPNLGPGTYTPIIEDGGGCRLELTPITINDVDPPTDLDFAQSNINCITSTSDVQLTPTSNFAIVNYSIISPVTINNGGSDIFIGLSTTTSYIFQITDANNCTYTEGFTPALISSIRARVKSGGDLRVCTGATDGNGTFLIDGFANNYTYNINGSPESAPQNNGEVDLPPSGAGTYTITVTDVDSGCTDTASFDILEPATAISLSGTLTAMTCDNSNLGRVVANASGGWGNNKYTLLFPDGFTTVGPKSGAVFGNLPQGGTYTLTVEDVEGCTDTFDFDLTPLSAPAIAIDAGASDYCYVAGPGATIAVTSTAGSAPLASHQYRVNGGTLQISPVFTGLVPGNYTVEIVDGNNCRDTITVTINPQLRVNTSIETEIPCGGAPGQIRVQVLGGYTSGPGPKQYEISFNGGAFGASIPLTSNSFLYDTTVAGDYVFRVTDNENCIALSNPISLNPPIAIDPATVSTTPVSCGNTDNGIVTIIPDATSGIPPYEISFNGGPFSSQTVYSNLAVGTYPFIVRDARGCETLPADAIISLSAVAPPDAVVSPTLASCSTGIVEGSIEVTAVVGGTPDYTYILQDQFGIELSRIGPTASTTESFLNLVPGIYTVVTIDALGCRDIDTVAVVQATLTVVPDPVVPVCTITGFSNTVEIFGGVGPFLIRLENDPLAPVTPNIPPRRHTFSGLQYGVTYTVEVTDLGTACIYLVEIPPVDGPTTLDVTASSTAGYCDTNRFGQIVYDVIGFAPGSDLIIELLNTDDGTRITLESPTNVSPTHSGAYEALPGNYQIIVTNLTDNCTDAVRIIIDQNLPAIDILDLTPANCNANGSITVQGSGGAGGPYTFAFMVSGSLPAPADFDTVTTFFAPDGSYDVFVKDSSGCTSFAIAEIIPLDPPLSAPTFIVENQCDVTSTSFDILVSVSGTVNTPRFTLGGDEQLGIFNGGTGRYEYTFNVSTPGDYIVDVIDANGCTGQGTATVYDFLSASGGFTTDPSCNAADGEITITTNGGSGDFSFQLQDSGGIPIGVANNTGVFSGLGPGSYKVLATDNIVFDGTIFCFFLVDNINMDAVVAPIILPTTPQDISCNGDDDGSIDIILQAGTDTDSPIDYRLLDFVTRVLISNNNSGSFSGLSPGTYEVEVVSSRNCIDLSGPLLIAEPPVFTISASAPDFTCEPGANRFSSTTLTTTITNPGTPGNYRYSISGFSNYQTGSTFEIIDDGNIQNITVYAIDDKGCEATASVTINPPTDVIPTIVQVDPLNCRDLERVRIEVSGTADFTVTTISAMVVPAVTNSLGNNYVDVFLPASGDYLFEVQDNEPGGCTYPMPKHTVIATIAPTVVINETKPVSCFGASDGEMSIEVTDYTGVYTYNVYSGSDPGKTTVLATASLDTANNPETILGLPGGNFFVEVVSTAIPFCSGDSNVETIRSPNGALDVTAIEVGNVGCNEDMGHIEATGVNGWDNAAYQYRLLRDDGLGYIEIVPLGATNIFQTLPSGDYRVEVRDVEACLDTFDITLAPIPAIQVGIREPQALVCPNGNNAILEAYDPTTGDINTATAGASGGFLGAGYNYRILYLNSNNNTDIASTSGLQNSPTFMGTSGGYISGGWYAIEVSSSFDCIGVSIPYFVDPPPPIEPKLVQTKVPGCGGMGEMRLGIENPDASFAYEYLQLENGIVIGTYTDMVGTSILIPGVAGITYQFDVRKKNASNTCLAVRSNGITMTDATGITLLPNLPDDISCASELDGRIESFINGGVGDNMFYLYSGDPVDAFSPAATATLVRGPQGDGTFEGLSEGADYYIAVTSGANCSDIAGPFEIVRPAPIVFTASSSPVTCTGEEDGTIIVEVSNGGVGLIQFAIAPNFSEFFSDPANPGTYTFDELAAGDYEILIQDQNGCFEKDVITVAEPEEIRVINVSSSPETCIGFEDGAAQLTITGGTPFVDPLTFVQYYETKLVGPNSDGSEVFVRNDNLYFDGLLGGETYFVFIQDANLCSTDVLVAIVIGVNLTAEPIVQYGCEGIFPNSTVTVQMQDTSLTPELLFALDPLDPTDAITALAGVDTTWGDLPAGNHTVYIFHENGCTNFVEFSIDVYDPLTLEAVKTGPNELTATAQGGYGGYEYFFQGESYGSETVFTTNESGNVSVRVVDQNGCVAIVTIPFEFTGMLEIPNFFTPNGDGKNDVWSPKNRDYFPNIEVKIYDRYGRVVALLNQVTNWNGNYEGSELPTGDYWYVVNANDKSKIRYVGHFTLYR
ncbi:MAG: T9SS type B sorting domain-containing protein [Flavobacteriaceae bacterium]